MKFPIKIKRSDFSLVCPYNTGAEINEWMNKFMTYERVEAMNKVQTIREVIQLYRSPRTNPSRESEIVANPFCRVFALAPIFARPAGEKIFARTGSSKVEHHQRFFIEWMKTPESFRRFFGILQKFQKIMITQDRTKIAKHTRRYLRLNKITEQTCEEYRKSKENFGRLLKALSFHGAQWWERLPPTNVDWVPYRPILVPRAHHPSGLQQGSRALGWSNTGSPRFTDFPSNLANLIGWEYETNTLRMLRKASPARARDLCRRPEGSWALGTRMIPARCHMWVESVVGSRFAPTVFLREL